MKIALKPILIGVGVVSTILCVVLAIRLISVSSDREMLTKQNAAMQSQIDAIGPTSLTWTVVADVPAGKQITDDDLIQQTLPMSSINENFILTKEELLGQFYKIALKPGTPLTKDVIMSEESTETLYERDVVLGFLPLGLEVGNYVDLRTVLPYGEEYIVIPHLRIYNIVENTIKVYLNEAQLALYTSVTTDRALYGARGLKVYATKYLEPGIAKPTAPFYPVRKEMESVVTLNPNIKDKSVCVNSALRDTIEIKLKAVVDNEAGLLNSGKSYEESNINNASKMYTNTNETVPVTGESQPDSSEPSGEDIVDLTEGAAEDIVNATDSQGNTSTVTQPQRDQAEGAPALDMDEDVIE